MLRVLLAALAVFVALTLYLFVFVRSDHAKRADAIVVLSGDRKRLATGLRLFRERVAPTLVISRDARAWPEADALCAGPHIVCFQANPYSTRGEARQIAHYERKRGWKRVVVVTSRYHLRRARMLFDRCGARPQMVASHTTFVDYAVDIPWEWSKLVYQLTRQRSC